MKKLMIALSAAAMALGLHAAPSVAGENFNGKTIDTLEGWTALGESSISSTAYSFSKVGTVGAPNAYRQEVEGENLAIKTAFSTPATWAFTATPIDMGSAYIDTLVKFTACDEDAEVPAGSNAKIMVWTKEIVDANEAVKGTNLYVTAGYYKDSLNTVEAKNYNCGSITKYKIEETGTDWCRLTIKSYAEISTAGDGAGAFAIAVNGVDVTIAEDFAIGVAESSYLKSLTAQAQVKSDSNRLFPSLAAAGENTLSAIGFAGQGAVDDISIDAVQPTRVDESTFLADSDIFTLKWKAADVTSVKYTIGGTEKAVANLSSGSQVIGVAMGTDILVTVAYADGKMAGEWTAENAEFDDKTFTFNATAAAASGTIVAQNIAATLNGKNYGTIGDAMSDLSGISTPGTYTLKLCAAVKDYLSFGNGYPGVKFILDLAGQNISVESDVAITASGANELTIIDSVGGATVSSGADNVVYVDASTTCNIEAGTYVDGAIAVEDDDSTINLLYKEGATLKINVAENADLASVVKIPEGKILKNNGEGYWVLADKPKAGFTMILADNAIEQYRLTADGAWNDYSEAVTGLQPGQVVYWQYVAADGYKITSATSSGNTTLVQGDNQIGATVVAKYYGKGTAEKPFLIYDRADLEGVKTGADSAGLYYQLANDIALDPDFEWKGIGAFNAKDIISNKDEPSKLDANKYLAGAFQGNFDGAGYSITDVRINRGFDYPGFFGSTYKATIKNLKIKLINFVDGMDDCGGAVFVGVAVGTTIENCEALETTLTTTKGTAGFIGYACCSNTIKGCINRANISSSNEKAAGFVACNQEGDIANFKTLGKWVVIEDCANYGNIECTTSGKDFLSGLVSYADMEVIFKGANIMAGTLTQAGGVGYSVAAMNGGTITIADGATFAVPAGYKTTKKPVDGLYFATVAEGVATLIKNAAVVKGGSYKVMAPGASITLDNVGDSITLDTSLATADVKTTAAGVVVKSGNVYTVEHALAKIGDVYYQTLEAAVAAAKAGETVEMLGNLEIADTVVSSEAITLDLGNFTLTKVAGTGNWAIKFAKDLVIKNGAISAVTYGVAASTEKSGLTLNKVSITAADRAVQLSDDGSDVTVGPGALVIDKDSVITSTSDDAILCGNGDTTHARIVTIAGTVAGSMTLSGNNTATISGSIANTSSKYPALYYGGTWYANVGDAGTKPTLTVTGIITSANFVGICTDEGDQVGVDLKIADKNAALSGYLASLCIQALNCTATVSEGTFTGAVDGSTLSNFISGGTFTVKPDDTLLVEGYEFVQDGDLWIVQKKADGPTVPPEQGEVQPVAGSETLVEVIPAKDVTEITISNVGDKQVIIPTSVTKITGVTADNLLLKTTEGTYSGILKLGSAGEVGLDATASVTIGEDKIPVTPTITEDSTTGIAEGAVATKAIPGLTYKLQRMADLGGEKTLVASEVAAKTTLSLKDTSGTKPADKAFYVIEVTK